MKQNRYLYEKLMRNISREVKKALNEVGDTPEGQRRLARLQDRNINRKINQWHQDNPDKLMASDEEKHDAGWWDIQHYAMRQSKGKDILRAAYDDEMGKLMFGDQHKGGYNRNYPNTEEIDVDGLYDELEAYVKKQQAKGKEVHIVTGVIDGIDILFEETYIPVRVIRNAVTNICKKYKVKPEAIDVMLSEPEGFRYSHWYEIHINVAYYDYTTNDIIMHNKFQKGEQQWWNDFCAMLS